MIKRILLYNSILFLLSCSMSFDKEIVNHGPNLKSFSDLNIKKNVSKKQFIIKKLGPPSFTDPYNKNNVYYISQKMRKEIGKVNQFESTTILEIVYNKDNTVINFNIEEEKTSNKIILSDLNDRSISSDRKVFEVLKNIFSNLRRNPEN